MVTRSKFHTVDPQTLGTTVKNLVATETWGPGFVHLCLRLNEINYFDRHAIKV